MFCVTAYARTFPERIRGSELAAWSKQHPDILRVSSIGKSAEGRDIPLLTIGRDPDEALLGWMRAYSERTGRPFFYEIAGERFGIGSAREMSPAGLKAIAEEAGLEIVIVCGERHRPYDRPPQVFP